jgi:hypothetical protein
MMRILDESQLYNQQDGLNYAEKKIVVNLYKNYASVDLRFRANTAVWLTWVT